MTTSEHSDQLVVVLDRGELGLVMDALDLMHDAEHLRPWKQDQLELVIDKVNKLLSAFDYARWRAEHGHTMPDMLYTIALILFILVMLRILGVV